MSNIAEVPDILLLIFEELVLEFASHLDDGQPPCLFPCVLVSRLWHELATPLLWRKVTPVSVWKLLPNDCRRLSNTGGRQGSLLELSRPLTNKDLEALTRLSYHVETICHSPPGAVFLAPSTIAALPPLGTLFLSLRRIIYRTFSVSDTLHDVHTFHAYLTSTVRFITLYATTKFVPDIIKVARCCPDLETIMVESKGVLNALTVRRMDTALGKLGRLTTVFFALPYPNELHHMHSVGRLPSLHSLLLSGKAPDGYMPRSQLTITLNDAPSARAVSAMLAAFARPARPIKALYLRPRALWPDDDPDPGMHHLAVLAARAAAYCSPSTLTRLHIECTAQSAPTPHALRVEHLRPLAGHTRLVCVHVQVSAAAALDDEAVAELAGWWPALEYLHLVAAPRGDDALCSLRALEALAVLCPRLRSLTIPLDATVVPEAVGDAAQAILGAMPRTWPDGSRRRGVQYLKVCGRLALPDEAGGVSNVTGVASNATVAPNATGAPNAIGFGPYAMGFATNPMRASPNPIPRCAPDAAALHAAAVATYLQALFPALAEVSCFGENGRTAKRVWSRVNNILRQKPRARR